MFNDLYFKFLNTHNSWKNMDYVAVWQRKYLMCRNMVTNTKTYSILVLFLPSLYLSSVLYIYFMSCWIARSWSFLVFAFFSSLVLCVFIVSVLSHLRDENTFPAASQKPHQNLSSCWNYDASIEYKLFLACSWASLWSECFGFKWVRLCQHQSFAAFSCSAAATWSAWDWTDLRDKQV